jgi:hypothetical protein
VPPPKPPWFTSPFAGFISASAQKTPIRFPALSPVRKLSDTIAAQIADFSDLPLPSVLFLQVDFRTTFQIRRSRSGFETNEQAHRDILRGVLRYERIHGPWSLQRGRRTRGGEQRC